jgi:hypothetical protein
MTDSDNELGKIWKEVDVAYFEALPQHVLGRTAAI